MADFSNLIGKKIRFNKNDKQEEGVVFGSYCETNGWFLFYFGKLSTENKLLVKTPVGKVEHIYIQQLTYVT